MKPKGWHDSLQAGEQRKEGWTQWNLMCLRILLDFARKHKMLGEQNGCDKFISKLSSNLRLMTGLRTHEQTSVTRK